MVLIGVSLARSRTFKGLNHESYFLPALGLRSQKGTRLFVLQELRLQAKSEFCGIF